MVRQVGLGTSTRRFRLLLEARFPLGKTFRTSGGTSGAWSREKLKKLTSIARGAYPMGPPPGDPLTQLISWGG